MNPSYPEALEALRRISHQMEAAGDVLLAAMIGDVIDVMTARIENPTGRSD